MGKSPTENAVLGKTVKFIFTYYAELRRQWTIVGTLRFNDYDLEQQHIANILWKCFDIMKITPLIFCNSP